MLAIWSLLPVATLALCFTLVQTLNDKGRTVTFLTAKYPTPSPTYWNILVFEIFKVNYSPDSSDQD